MLADLILALGLGGLWLWLRKAVPRLQMPRGAVALFRSFRQPLAVLLVLAIAIAGSLLVQEVHRFGWKATFEERTGGAPLSEHVACFERQRRWQVQRQFSLESGQGLCPAKGVYSLDASGRATCSVHGSRPQR